MVPLVLLAIALPPSLSDAAPSPSQSNISDPTKRWHEAGNGINGKWISQIMADELPHFMPYSNRNIECNRQVKLFQDHLTNLTLWAVQMYDASSFSEVGLLNGNEYTNGHYDQCVRVNVPEFNIKGQYCNAFMKISPDYFNTNEPQNFSTYKNISPFSSVWAKIQRVEDERIKHRNRFYWGICIPSGCNNFDLEESLKALLIPAFKRNNITTEIIVDEASCSIANNNWNLSTGAYVYLILVGGLTLLVLIATFFHDCLTHSSQDGAKEESSVFLSFSAINNTKLLLEQEKTPELRTLSGMKVLSMIIIIYGHRMLMSLYWPLFNAEYLEESMESFSGVINMNGSIIVNTFLYVSGFLVYNKIISDIKKGRSINIPLYIFYRWAKVVPIYLFLICTLIFVKPLYSNQPMYKQEGAWRVDACAKNWWTYILFINNYYNAEHECILPAWYLAVDMQLYIVAVLTGYIMSKSKKSSYIILGLLLVASEIIPAVITYVKNYGPVLKLYINFLDTYYKQEEYLHSYIPTHMRAPPYFIGMLAAILLEKLKMKEYILPKYLRIIGSIMCTAFALGSLCYAWTFFAPEWIPSLLENSLYVSIHRFTWSVAMAWITISSALHCHSKITAILRRNIFTPFNKLMLHALLIHSLIQAKIYVVQRQPTYTDLFVMLWSTSGDVMSTYICSYVSYLIISAPISRLQDMAIKRLLKK